MKSKINRLVFFLASVLSFTSSHFEKSLKIYGLILYPIISYTILIYVFNNVNPITRIIEKYNPKLLFLLFLFTLIITYSVWYPYEDIRSKGSDRDEALNQAVTEITHLKYPYYVRTIVSGKSHELKLDNNPITVMPGSVLFAAPFVLLGNSTYQNFFWLALLFIILTTYYQSESYSILFIILNTFLCGTFLFQILIGSDYIANSIWVLIFTHLFIQNSKFFGKKSFLYSFLLGIGLSSRFNFLIILVPLTVYLYNNTNLLNTIKQMASIIIGFLIITVPFLVYDYDNFTPLHFSNVYRQFNQMIPYSSVIFPVLVLALSFATSLYFRNDQASIYFQISISLLIPVCLIVILHSIAIGKLTFELSHYAFPAFLFLSFAIFDELYKGNLSNNSLAGRDKPTTQPLAL